MAQVYYIPSRHVRVERSSTMSQLSTEGAHFYHPTLATHQGNLHILKFDASDVTSTFAGANGCQIE